MDMSSYVDEVLLRLGGGVLKLEIADNSIIEKIINLSFSKVRDYLDTTKLVTVPYTQILDLKPFRVSKIRKVYRPDGAGNMSTATLLSDPVYLQQRVFTNYNGYGGIASDYQTFMMQQRLRNTAFSEIIWNHDKDADVLYTKFNSDIPANMTIEYVPRYESVDEITSDYWIDRIRNLAYAMACQILGKIRGKYTLSNGLYTIDAADLKAEGDKLYEAEMLFLNSNRVVGRPLN